jgi:polar amino acid transport system ATP-binding protein
VSADGIVRAERINKWFHRGHAKEQHVLRDIDLTVTKGETLVVIGPSGSGKSTLLRCINFLAPPETGSVTFLGETLSQESLPRFDVRARLDHERRLRHFRTKIGMVFQHFNLFPHMTALDNVAAAPIRVLGLPKVQARARALEELERVGMGAKAKAYPNQLSGGQKQRVAIARALAMEPKVLLFDEPTSALDPSLVGEVLGVMEELAHEGTTMIVVTHELDFAREAADRVLFMEEGVFIEEGPPEQVLDAPKNPLTRIFLERFLREGRGGPAVPVDDTPAPIPPPIGHTV